MKRRKPRNILNPTLQLHNIALILEPLTARNSNRQSGLHKTIFMALGVNILDEKINRRSNVDLHRFIHTLDEIPPRCLHAHNTQSANAAAIVGHYTRTISTRTQKRIYLATDSCSAEWQCFSCAVYKFACLLTYLLTYLCDLIHGCSHMWQRNAFY